MTKSNPIVWKILHIVSWIIFIGLCIQTGTLLFNYFYSLFNPIASHNLYLGLNLSELYNSNKNSYTHLFVIIILLSALKAIVFYFIIKLFLKLNLIKPFNIAVTDMIMNISYVTLAIGLFGIYVKYYTESIIHSGIDLSTINRFLVDSEAYLFMSAIIYVIALIFKKGIELQSENELTI